MSAPGAKRPFVCAEPSYDGYSTGNTGHSLRDGDSERPVLKKPFKYEELAAILAGLKLAPIE
jgi:hypothetical protein